MQLLHDFFCTLVLLFSLGLTSGLINEEVSQIIDASTSVVRYSAEIKASGVKGEYVFLLPTQWGENLAFFSAQSKGKALVVSPPVSSNNFTELKILVPDEEDRPTLKLKAVFTEILLPYPAEISQSDQQLVALDSNHFYLSQYHTNTQKSVYKLASSSVESFTKITPSSVRGSSIHFGPFQNIAPLTLSESRIHFVNNFPFAKFSNLIREVEVSHWGSISFEEIYELKHAGAKLKGGFSRFDYQMKRMNQSPSFRSLVAHLPAQATNIYYRDQIGNISTSDIKAVAGSGLELEIQTRFPMFGGWQTQFYIGYAIPTELALFRSGDNQYRLEFDFFTIFENVWVDEMEVKVVLPEGCENIRISTPYTVAQSDAVRYSYLDSQLNGGRKVLVLKAHNIVEEHNQKVVITYDFQQRRMAVEPLMLVAVFAAVFFGCSLISRATALSTKSLQLHSN